MSVKAIIFSSLVKKEINASMTHLVPIRIGNHA